MAELTPMMRQYMEIKEQNPDSILFFRLGDFYEMFGPDARTASRELDLALTTRDKDKTKSFDDKIPMCGIPYHASDAYIARLIAKGYKVAICEQTEDPAAAKGLVKRDIIRVVTPGTVIDESCLSAERSNYLCGVYLDDTGAGLCACDISTGKAQATVFTGPDRVRALLNELGRFAPAEAVMNETAFFNETLHQTLQDRFSCHMEKLSDARFTPEDAEKKVRAQFGQDALERLPRDNMTPRPATHHPRIPPFSRRTAPSAAAGGGHPGAAAGPAPPSAPRTARRRWSPASAPCAVPAGYSRTYPASTQKTLHHGMMQSFCICLSYQRAMYPGR